MISSYVANFWSFKNWSRITRSIVESVLSQIFATHDLHVWEQIYKKRLTKNVEGSQNYRVIKK